MYQQSRLDAIMKILSEYNYVTVKYLVDTLHYSNATINRDLNILEAQKLVKRSYGGVERLNSDYVPLDFRYHKMKNAKSKIGEKAADLVSDGDIIFIDASTTTQSMEHYILDKKDICVITNNLKLVSHLSLNGVNVICLGGHVSEAPSMLSGDLAVENAMKYRADKFFFSTSGMSFDGKIASSKNYGLLHRVMSANSKKTVYLLDHEKIGLENDTILFDLNKVDYVICDFEFDRDFKSKFQNTEFISAL